MWLKKVAEMFEAKVSLDFYVNKFLGNVSFLRDTFYIGSFESLHRKNIILKKKTLTKT